jgi:magnesium-transporting ATPase (P-type)
MADQLSFSIDFAYFCTIFLLALNVYIQTRKIDSFSFHRGIRYFRNAFLFFSIIYIFRLYVLNLQVLNNVIAPDSETTLLSLGFFLVIYFTLLAILNLMSSFSWNKFRFISDHRVNLAAVLISCVVFFLKVPIILLLVGIVVALFLLIRIYSNHRKGRKFSPLFIIYALLLVFILFDLLPITQALIPFEFSVLGYVGSICIFLYINLKVKKVLAAGKEEEK